ncbi:glycosyltransferase [Thioclava sp. F36-6]|uniref:glycosyltransferase n=1 Tax=Thioclava sp. F36-6 TaxID=1915316 RepID=UPI0011BAD2FE|nr:glycosyltransferase [Thioclava sp. F36-6]
MTQGSKAAAAHLVHMRSFGGHRREYLTLFSRMFTLEASTGKVSRRNILRLARAKRLLFGTIDDDYLGFFLVGMLRAALGRRTVGVFLRPQTCFNTSGLRYRIKKAAFATARMIPRLSVFTIVPFSVAPEYASIATGGLIDPQMWDQYGSRNDPLNEEIYEIIKNKAAGRKVLSFIGSVTEIKGTRLLNDLLNSPDWPADKLLLVIAGKFPHSNFDLADKADRIGSLVIDRYVTDQEISGIYQASDLVWCCYHPEYNQASGIFGRSIQFRRTPIVRRHSIIERVSKEVSAQCVPLDYESPTRSLDAIRENVATVESAETFHNLAFEDWESEFYHTVDQAL